MELAKDRNLFFQTLNVLLGLIWLFLAFDVTDRAAWALENILVILFVPLFVILFKKKYLSMTSYFLIFIFLSLHLLGAHYTYAKVPYEEWSKALFNESFNAIFDWQRNHFDRLLHFLFGFLLFIPMREYFGHVVPLKKKWLSVFCLLIVISFSAIFELLEWAVAVNFGNSGSLYLGTQGDEWDAHKDQLCAIVGALITWGVYAVIPQKWISHYLRMPDQK